MRASWQPLWSPDPGESRRKSLTSWNLTLGSRCLSETAPEERWYGRGRGTSRATYLGIQEAVVAHAATRKYLVKYCHAPAAGNPSRSTHAPPALALRPASSLLFLLPHADGKWQVDEVPDPGQRLPEDRILPWHLFALHEATLSRTLQASGNHLTTHDARRNRHRNASPIPHDMTCRQAMERPPFTSMVAPVTKFPPRDAPVTMAVFSCRRMRQPRVCVWRRAASAPDVGKWARPDARRCSHPPRIDRRKLTTCPAATKGIEGPISRASFG